MTWHAYALPSGQALYFSGQAPGDVPHLYRVGIVEGMTSPIARLDSLASSEGEQAPVVTADEQVVFFTRYSSTTSYDVFVATRSLTSDPFGSARKVDELSTARYDHVTWVSADGCRVYVNSDRNAPPGFEDIFVADRP